MNSGSLNERITRALAFMLRHQPEEFDLELDRFGWGDLEDVVYALQERTGSTVEEEDVAEAIESSDRPRYEIKDGKIRALYGHSIQIDPGEPTEPPDELFIGVGSRDASRAEDSGLRSGRRAFLHLARTEEEARESGRRIARDYAVVTVFAGEAFDEGTDFYDRGALFLADEIPGEFLEVGEIQHDGIERDDNRRSRGRRNADGPRGPRRGRGRGRGRGDRDDDRPSGRDRGRDREEPRREEPRRDREEPRREEPRREDPPRKEPAGETASSFGVGLAGGAAAAASEEQASPRPEPKRAEPKPEPKAEPRKQDREEESDSAPSGFGAGL
ncbi:MAG: RNA 2'-phosphotransferase [Planctomycetes bacterium]|nr:RNA 2'-phosphotransferase [Planctomycetota bacterium]